MPLSCRVARWLSPGSSRSSSPKVVSPVGVEGLQGALVDEKRPVRATYIGSVGVWSLLDMATGVSNTMTPEALCEQIGGTFMIDDIDGLKATGKAAKRRKEKELKAVRRAVLLLNIGLSCPNTVRILLGTADPARGGKSPRQSDYSGAARSPPTRSRRVGG